MVLSVLIYISPGITYWIQKTVLSPIPTSYSKAIYSMSFILNLFKSSEWQVKPNSTRVTCYCVL